MKPLTIEFSAFGSYPGEVSVDFTSLAARGLFVVTGDTGTGKTTIFDAMSFALFGEMPSKDGNDIRSHHADPTATTLARFTFELDGVVHVAERSPEYQRLKRTGKGTTKESAKGTFTRVEADGSTSVLASGVREMNRTVPEVVGLDAAQFRRVMLLPQGEVAKFLLDDSANRETLLGALFGGEVYDRIGKVLEEEAKSLAAGVRASEEQIRHHTTNATARLAELHQVFGIDMPDDLGSTDGDNPIGRERLGQLAATVVTPHGALTAEAEARSAAAATAERALADAEATVLRMRQAEAARRRLAELAEHEPAIAAAAAAAEASQRIRPVLVAHDNVVRAQGDADAAAEVVADLISAIGRVAVEHGITLTTESATAAAADLGRIATLNDAEQRLLGAVTDAASLADRQRCALDDNERDLDAARTAHTTATERLAAILIEEQSLDEQSADTTALDAEHDELTSARQGLTSRDRLSHELAGLIAAADTAADDYEAMLRRFIDTEAPRLAAQLRDGEPCAVCGSPDHPAPATADGGEPVDFAMVEQARERSTTATARRRDAEAALAAVREGLGPLADADPPDIDVRIADNRRRHGAAEAVTAQLAELTRERDTVTADQTAAATRIATLEGQASVLANSVADAEAAVESARSAAAGVDADALARRHRGVDQLSPLVSRLPVAFEAKSTTAATTTAARAVLDTALLTAGCADVDAARSLAMSVADERAALDARDRSIGERNQTEGQLAAFVADGIPDVEPDIASLQTVAEQTRATAKELGEQRVRADRSMTELQEALDGIDTVDAGSADLRRRAELTQRAQLVCRGQVAPRVSLRRWVLGRELERVVDAASEHLIQMTGGRYTIRRVADAVGGQSAKGLDLEIHDAHTGRARKPNSLSGGEQFQASLALALGLADVVSRGGAGSGRRIEALFVDEGFGSLDPRALDDAIETLHQLQATGRMVGAITHVEAMKERLHTGIVVSRLADGRGSTLTVNP